MPTPIIPVEVYRFLRDECGSRFIQFIPIIERVPAGEYEGDTTVVGAQPGLLSTAPWSSWRDRPLYTQEGDYVTDRSVTARTVRQIPDRCL